MQVDTTYNSNWNQENYFAWSGKYEQALMEKTVKEKPNPLKTIFVLLTGWLFSDLDWSLKVVKDSSDLQRNESFFPQSGHQNFVNYSGRVDIIFIVVLIPLVRTNWLITPKLWFWADPEGVKNYTLHWIIHVKMWPHSDFFLRKVVSLLTYSSLHAISALGMRSNPNYSCVRFCKRPTEDM